MERRLAAILAADVVGYTALMGADEAGTLRRLTALRREVLEPLIADHHGRVVKLMGDGFLVEFASVVDAVSCALAWQQRLAEEPSGLNFRIGINLGDVIVEDDDIHGDGVNIAARLEGLAEPGGICLSGDVYRQAKGKIEAVFESMGERSLKNVAEPVLVYRIAGARSEAPAAEALPLPDKPSIAVLPFTNMSGDSEQEYFSDGITEDIITELSRFRSLFVIARQSSFRYKGKELDIGKIGRELGVRYVIEGSVRRAGGRVRITAQLIEAESGSHIWAERYDRSLEDIFAVQEEVSRTIAATLMGRVEQDRLELTKIKRPDSLAAYDYLLRGKTHVGLYTEHDVKSALESLQKAIEISPGYAEAHAWLALCHAFQYAGWWSKDPERSLETAVTLGRKAVEMDQTVGQAHGSLAYALVYKREYRQALHHFERAITLVPCDAENTANYGWCLVFDGKPDQGLEWIEKGERLNPLHDWWYAWLRGMAHYGARRYDQALDALRQVVSPPVEVEGWRAAAYAQVGDLERAKSAAALFETRARAEFAVYPGEHPDGWRHYWRSTEPFRTEDDEEHLCDGLRRAGLAI